jgi:hypothetical protein
MPGLASQRRAQFWRAGGQQTHRLGHIPRNAGRQDALLGGTAGRARRAGRARQHQAQGLFAAVRSRPAAGTRRAAPPALAQARRPLSRHRVAPGLSWVPAAVTAPPGWDNLATHKTPEVQQWLARRSRFHLHFTPTGSSWINQVRWFGYLTDQKIRRGVHKSVQVLEADIRAWIDTWNENPSRAFTWTKTAEEILNSLAEYITRISGGSQ